MTKNSYVDNVSFQKADSDRDNFLAQAVEVESVRILANVDAGRSGGFLERREENPQHAISRFDGSDLKRLALTVIDSRLHVHRGGGGPSGGGYKRL